MIVSRCVPFSLFISAVLRTHFSILATSDMDPIKHAEEILREAACLGDEEGVKAIIKAGVNVNVQHNVNGWTALHWATKRGRASIVRYLLACGADATVKSAQGETPLDLAPNDEIREILTCGKVELLPEKSNSVPLPITPNYLKHPQLAYKVDLPESCLQRESKAKPPTDVRIPSTCDQELVIKVRTSNPPHQDFIEVEIPYKDLSFANVLKICCDELEVNVQKVLKLRKLPNTMLRKDKDVQRLHNFTELEVVLQPDAYTRFNSGSNSSSEINGFIKNVSALNKGNTKSESSNLFEKSNFCKNGIILY